MRLERENKVQNFRKSNDQIFINACAKAGVPATRRQASKWLSKKGAAYRVTHK